MRDWEKWFAWFPVRTNDGKTAFLITVERYRAGTASSYGADERDVTWS